MRLVLQMINSFDRTAQPLRRAVREMLLNVQILPAASPCFVQANVLFTA
jgi:hypothetical protein